MNKHFSDDALEDYLYWQPNDKAILKRINKLIRNVEREGYFKGIGKPEPLKHNLSGCWSRRINDEHRLIYRINENYILIASCKDHY
ncbi:Txe/YoeB family addiction module toxin [Acidaminobacter sp. JC074]|uniref:Txe/YoeB family addiction module toxin n=1 Tax=Acidaminobacter sp. JC074 TaxID=2530199 RepID=UPI001F10B320|nr:Txe/YoeB family addiction module toxin [Acidaminobacter sp. JC074]MCH4886691.1 Txe/YoeB family addiction module toxin [Acidaminobacter sp. JC074]